MCAMAAVGANAEDSGDFTYSVLTDGTAQITKYNGSASTLIVPSTLDGYVVSGIGESAFENCKSIQIVVLEDSITKIGALAFSGCTNLRKMYILNPDCVINVCQEGNTIYDGAVIYGHKGSAVLKYASNNQHSTRSFGAYTGLSGVDDCYVYNVLSDNTVEIVSYFGNETEVTLPLYVDGYAVKSLWSAFYDSSVVSVTIPYGYDKVGDNAFEFSSDLRSVVISDSVTEIGAYAFYECSNLQSVVIGDGVKTIGKYAFSACSSLSFIALNKGLISIDKYAFYNCNSLETITLYEEITSVGNSAFKNCNSLSEVVFFSTQCSFGTNIVPATATIYAHSDSTARKYADANSVAYRVICEATGVGHTEVVDKGYEATFSAPGLTDGVHCSVCDKVLVEQQVIPMLSYTLGEVDNDGVITIIDATYIQKYLASLCDLSDGQKLASDTDKDGDITILDATRIQQYLALIIDEI